MALTTSVATFFFASNPAVRPMRTRLRPRHNMEASRRARAQRRGGPVEAIAVVGGLQLLAADHATIGGGNQRTAEGQNQENGP